MEILFTEQFEQAYEKLTHTEKRSVCKALALLDANPKYLVFMSRKWKEHRTFGKFVLQRDCG